MVRTRPMGDHASQSYVDSFGMYWHRQNKVLAPLFLEGYERYNHTVDRLLQEATTTAELEEVTALSASNRRVDRGCQRSGPRLPTRRGHGAELVGPSTPVMDTSCEKLGSLRQLDTLLYPKRRLSQCVDVACGTPRKTCHE